MSLTTKRALAASLKKLLTQKPLDKITVVDITSDCEVNRQTFYYHFQDIYDLIEWIYSSEATNVLGDKKTAETWQEGLLNICNYALENRAFVISTYHSVSREHLEQYLYHETYSLLWNIVEEKSKGIPIHEEDKAFIANFYKYAFVGLLLDWTGRGMRDDPHELVDHLSRLIHGSISAAIDRFRCDRPHTPED